VITEDMPFAGYANDYIRSKRDAETLLRAAGSPFVSLRPGIVLSRGIDDAKLSRNMLWSIPVMAELGDVPLDPMARLDFAPVDFIASAFAEMLLKDTLAHDCYHVSTGEDSMTFKALADELTATMPGIGKLVMRGRDYVPTPKFARQRWMFDALQPYLPFLTADAVFSNARLRDRNRCSGHCARACQLSGGAIGDVQPVGRSPADVHPLRHKNNATAFVK
jgi:nucleoside-diphosphate-sugar epimerase